LWLVDYRINQRGVNKLKPDVFGYYQILETKLEEDKKKHETRFKNLDKTKINEKMFQGTNLAMYAVFKNLLNERIQKPKFKDNNKQTRVSVANHIRRIL
jgi:hypothetical protein